jgi:mono/diheme cytochrome c family protein
MKARVVAAAVLAIALTGCPRLDPMQRQPKQRAYQPSDVFSDGMAMRQPPAGTVPYGAVLEPAVATGLGPDGRPLARAPVAPTPELLARGRTRFEILCAACHGLMGDGESQVALNMALRRPPSLHAYRDVPDGHIYRVVSNGFGLMPSYASELSVADRWAVVAYVRALQLSQRASLDQVPPDARRRLQEEAQ